MKNLTICLLLAVVTTLGFSSNKEVSSDKLDTLTQQLDTLPKDNRMKPQEAFYVVYLKPRGWSEVEWRIYGVLNEYELKEFMKERAFYFIDAHGYTNFDMRINAILLPTNPSGMDDPIPDEKKNEKRSP